MVELPRGTVTLVFTDIEGSTRLLALLGSRYEEALSAHRRLVREAFSSHGGIEVDTQGDAFFCSFARAQDAVAGALAAQRSLASHDFGDGVELRVRMGIHTGEPTVSDEGYIGSDVHLGARISAVAWGGQVVVSSSTAALVARERDGISLRSLGEHALKDIEGRVELHQVVAPGLAKDFPALRSLSSHPTNLPARLAPLIGRDEEAASLTELLTSPEVSMVTLVGAGGTGKTSLSLAVGAGVLSSFPDGVFFVDLSALTDASLVLPAITQALSLREAPGRSLQESLAAHLASKEMLLVLDNFEQVMGAASQMSSLLEASSALKILVTSREALRIQAERVIALAPLVLPSRGHSDVGEVARSAAVALFVERARAVRADFSLTEENVADVAGICRRLDGLPLALELAAARINLLSPSSLLARLDHRLKVLSGGRRDASARQRTLRGAIEWSYGLLSEDERRLFRRLGVFAGGWTIEAAAAACDRGDLELDVFDGLASLVDKSLVRAMGGQEERFSMLETIRELALEKLEETGEFVEIRRSHAEFFWRLTEDAEPHLIGEQHKEWLNRLEREHENIRGALDSLAEFNERQPELLMAIALRNFWRFHGHLSEGRGRFESALANPTEDDILRERALAPLGLIAYSQGDYPTARKHLEEALEIEKRNNLRHRVAGTLNDLGLVAKAEGDYEGARTLCEETIRIARDVGDDFLVALGTANLADLALIEERFEDATLLAAESLSLWRELDDTEGIAIALANSAFAALKRDRLAEAGNMLSDSLSVAKDLGSAEIVAGCLGGFAAIAAMCGQTRAAARLLGAAENMREGIGAAAERFEAKLEQTSLSLVKARLDDANFQDVISQGRVLSTEEAIAEALGVSCGPSSGHG